MNRDDLRKRLNGPIASLVTPFDQEGRLCPEGLLQEINFLLAAGIKVLACNGSIGEFSSLTTSERKQVLELTLKYAGDDALIVTGCASSDLATVLELSDHAAAQGAHAIMLTAPYYFKSTSQELYEFFRVIDTKLTLPWIIYNNPTTTRADIPLDLIVQFSKMEHFAALKESSADMVRYYEEQERFGSIFPIIAAAEPVIVFQLLAGAAGLMTATVDFAPTLMRDLWTAASEKKTEQAFALFSGVFQIRKLMSEAVGRGFPAFVQYTKAALEIQGIPVGPPRAPLSVLPSAEKARLVQVLAQVLKARPVETTFDDI
jgi:4-hydroxy-tetrahydrodipicolinate synthase